MALVKRAAELIAVAQVANVAFLLEGANPVGTGDLDALAVQAFGWSGWRPGQCATRAVAGYCVARVARIACAGIRARIGDRVRGDGFTGLWARAP